MRTDLKSFRKQKPSAAVRIPNETATRLLSEERPTEVLLPEDEEKLPGPDEDVAVPSQLDSSLASMGNVNTQILEPNDVESATQNAVPVTSGTSVQTEAISGSPDAPICSAPSAKLADECASADTAPYEADTPAPDDIAPGSANSDATELVDSSSEASESEDDPLVSNVGRSQPDTLAKCVKARTKAADKHVISGIYRVSEGPEHRTTARK